LARKAALVDAAGGTWSDELRAIATNAPEGAAIVERRPAIYLAAFPQDLETMPPEVVLGRVARFLRNDLGAVLAIPDWRDLSWHVDRRGRDQHAGRSFRSRRAGRWRVRSVIQAVSRA
jgi:hypothetical protein